MAESSTWARNGTLLTIHNLPFWYGSPYLRLHKALKPGGLAPKPGFFAFPTAENPCWHWKPSKIVKDDKLA
jgi:hypothetical protein